MKFPGKVGNGPIILVAIRVTDPDTDPGDTGKACLGGGMQCPSASSAVFYCKLTKRLFF